MSTHKAVGTDTEEIMYADEFVIDEGGIDLIVDGQCVLGVSFDHVDNFQLAYEVLPESFICSSKQEAEDFEKLVQASADNVLNIPDVDLELAARAFLTALARRNGYEK